MRSSSAGAPFAFVGLGSPLRRLVLKKPLVTAQTQRLGLLIKQVAKVNLQPQVNRNLTKYTGHYLGRLFGVA